MKLAQLPGVCVGFGFSMVYIISGFKLHCYVYEVVKVFEVSEFFEGLCFLL